MNKSTLILLLFTLPLLMFSQEGNAILCADGLDNDGDGYIDCEDAVCANIMKQGCAICPNGRSFADQVIRYKTECRRNYDPNPKDALGVADYRARGAQWDQIDVLPEIVMINDVGYIQLGFTNNVIANSGNPDPDVHVFLVTHAALSPIFDLRQFRFSLALRPADEYTRIQLQALGLPDENNDGFFELIQEVPFLSSVDIDVFFPGYSIGQLLFDAIEIGSDTRGVDGCTRSPGPYLDGVCALTTVPVDGEGVINGTAIRDDCGDCFQPTDPFFNQACTNELLIPSAFTPNGDQINDLFQIFTGERVSAKVKKYLVYNQWGKLVYTAENFPLIKDSPYWWNGEQQGRPAPQGVYAYFIEVWYENKELKSTSGTVTLLR